MPTHSPSTLPAARRQFLLMAAGLVGLSASSVRADTIRWIDPIPGVLMQEVDKPVTSMRALRTRGIIIQRTDYSCGAAALATVLHQQFGLKVDEDMVIRGMLQFAKAEVVQQSGFSLLDMRRYVDSLGLRGSGFRIGPERLFELKVPVITLIDLKGYRHFVIVKHAADGRVYVADPSYGHRSFRLEDFVEMWTGVILAVTGREASRDSVLMDRRTPSTLSQREHVLPTRVGQATADFGFRSLDLF
jgi:predicted double-glycine peptidase